jgi:hypothetical protein
LHVHPLTPRDAPHQHVQQEDPTQNNTEEVEPFEIEFEEEHEQQQDTDNDEQQQQVSNNNEQQQQDYNDDQLEEEHEQQQDTDNDEQEQQVSDNNEQQQQDYNDDQHQESDYTLENDPEESDTEKQPVYHDAFEFRSYGDESPTIVSQLCSLLFHLNIIDALKFKIKRIPQPGRQEFRATVEIYNGSQMVRKHKGPAFRSTCAEAISDAAWQAMTSFNCTRRDKLKDSVYSLFPRRKKNIFKVSGVKIDVPKTMTIHSQNLNIQLSSRLNTAQKEIHFLHTQLSDIEKTMRSYERIIDG